MVTATATTRARPVDDGGSCKNRSCDVYPVGWTIVIRCSTVCRTLYCASCSLYRTPLHDWSLARDVVITSRLYYANSHWLPIRERVKFKVACMVRQSLSGEAPLYLVSDCCLVWVSPSTRRSLWSADVPTCVVGQLRRQNFCSRWTSRVELSSGPAAQSIHHYGLFRRQLKRHVLQEAWTRRSVTSDMRRFRKTVQCLLRPTYIWVWPLT